MINNLVKNIMREIEKYTEVNKADLDDVLAHVIDMLVVISGLRNIEPIIIENKEE